MKIFRNSSTGLKFTKSSYDSEEPIRTDAVNIFTAKAQDHNLMAVGKFLNVEFIRVVMLAMKIMI